jgi:Cu-Zn family superoxide dismutase
MLKCATLCCLFTLAGCFLLGPSYAYLSPLYTPVKKAVALVYPTQGNTASGVVTFVETKEGLQVTAQLQGLTPGKHGFHIHEHGNCSCPDANCAGDHYNPTHEPHGGPTDHKRHVGDFGNVEADNDGKVTITFIDTRAKLNGPHSIIGRSVIVHAQPDDLTTQPSGNAGARVGCGVIGTAANPYKK